MAAEQSPRQVHAEAAAAPYHYVNYYLIFVALLALTILTIGVATHRFNSEYKNVLAALLIAVIKGTFVARYFMHLKFEGKLIYLIFFGPITLCVLLIAALMPDIGFGPSTAFNDVAGWFGHLFPPHAAHGPY